MPEIDETINESLERAREGSRLNNWVAILVALTATGMALCNIKDGNITQAMEYAHTKANDQWSFYQSKSLKQHMMELGRDQARLRLDADGGLTPAARARYQKAADDYTAEIKRYDAEKETIKKDAEKFEQDYDALNLHDDQFDMSDAFFSIAIAIAGITALTQKKWLFWGAVGLSALGAFFGLAGFLGWTFHPELLAKIFGA